MRVCFVLLLLSSADHRDLHVLTHSYPTRRSSDPRLGAITMPEARRYSCVMAIHTLWLAARTRGIGMGWVSILERATVDAMLAIPENWRDRKSTSLNSSH